MFYSKSYPFKKQDLLFISLLLFGIASILIGVPFKKNDHKLTQEYLDVALNHDLAPPMASSSWESADFFAPGIAATMGSATQTYYKDSPGCTNIRFVIRVFNTSTNGEALNNITIDIAPDVVIGDLIAGDINFNNQIDEGEVWAYEAFKLITETDMQVGEVFHQAHVEATVVGLGSIVSDDSHPSDMNLDGPTLTKISNCGVGISLILTGVTKDGNGIDGGCSSVELTYELHNTGFVGETFESVVLKDPNVGDILEPDAGNDFNISILDQGEVWIYKVSYVPTAEEWLAGQIEVQGYVEAISANQGPGILITDVSDPVDLNGHNTTIINISPCTPKISLIQTGVINNCNSIDFTYTVTNESDPNNGQGQILQGISVAELNLPVVLDGPFNDINDDLLMDPGEFWTYTASYPLTAADIMAGEVVAQSNVAAFTDIPINMSVEDISDFEDVTLDRETVIDISSCTPRIALIKEGVPKDDLNQDGGCSYIEYTFKVTNESLVNQSLENITLTDFNLPLVFQGPTGDNGDNLLDKGETWEYTSIYKLTTDDINTGLVQNQAEVTANKFGLLDLTVTDLSDPVSVDDDQPTITDLSHCVPKLGLIKQGVVSPDCSTIEYTFTVTNESGNGQTFENVVLTDLNLPLVIQGPIGDIDDDNLLKGAPEVWTYTATYNITAEDINTGHVDNQAKVTADVWNFPGLSTEDLSDDDSVLEDDVTSTDLLSCQTPSIQLIKTGNVNIDNDNNGCFDGITYTFTVTNTGNVDLHTIDLQDDQIDEPAPVLLPNEDDNNDGILSIGEDWVFEGTHALIQADIDNGFVVNNADVAALSVGDNTPVADNQQVQTDLPIDLCAPAPAIELLKVGEVNIDNDNNGCLDGITYTFTVTNIGNVDLHTVILNDDKIGGVVPGPLADNMNDGILSIGEFWEYQATYDLVQADIDAGFVINNADVSALSVGDNTPVADNQQVQTDLPVDLCAPAPSIGLIKTGEPTDDDNDGCAESILYTFTVTNTGNVDLQNVVLNDPMLGNDIPGPLPGFDQNQIGILDIGESWNYQATYNLVQQDINNGFVENQATVSASSVGDNTPVADLSDDDNLAEDQITHTILPPIACVPVPTIELLKVGDVNIDNDNNGCLDGITYTFTVTNTGNVDLHTIDLQDDQIDEPAPVLQLNEDDNNDGILSIGEDWVFKGTHALIQADIDNGFVVNNADVSALSIGNDTPVADNQQVQTDLPVELCAPAPAIELLKVGEVNIDNDNNGCLDGITYTFTVTNTGNVDLHTIDLQDDQIDEPAPVLEPNEDDNNDGILSIGEDWVFKGTHALIQADIDNGFVVNNADVAALSVGDNTPVADNQQVQTDLPVELCSPTIGILLNKTGNPNIDADQDGCIDGVRYTFTVTNIGNVELQNIVLNDPMLGGDILGPIADDLNDGILSVDEIWEYQADYMLTDTDKNNGSVENQATVSATSIGDNTPVSDIQNAQTILPADLCNPLPGIALIKTGTLTDLNMDGCNESILYSFRVLNIGELALESIVVVDPMLGGVVSGPLSDTDENNDGILSQGESWNYELLYAITQQDIDMGSVTNQATATANVVGDNQEVSDFSDDNSPSEDDPTNTIVPNDVCTYGGVTIGLIKTGALADTNNDECPESILYTFSVTNTGEFELTDVQLTDQQLLGGTIAGPVDGTDNGNDGVLSQGETWTYNATYPISEEDVLNGFVTNQATVTANAIGIVASIFDVSDDDSLDENDMTMTSVPDFMCSVDPGADEAFEIFSGVTPNGDGFNDYFRINGIENYPDNVLKIFNRWGALVYQSEGYGIGNNLFYGVSEGKATILKEKTLPSGTYFYILTFPTDNPGQASYSGYLYINRN